MSKINLDDLVADNTGVNILYATCREHQTSSTNSLNVAQRAIPLAYATLATCQDSVDGEECSSLSNLIELLRKATECLKEAINLPISKNFSPEDLSQFADHIKGQKTLVDHAVIAVRQAQSNLEKQQQAQSNLEKQKQDAATKSSCCCRSGKRKTEKISGGNGRRRAKDSAASGFPLLRHHTQRPGLSSQRQKVGGCSSMTKQATKQVCKFLVTPACGAAAGGLVAYSFAALAANTAYPVSIILATLLGTYGGSLASQSACGDSNTSHTPMKNSG